MFIEVRASHLRMYAKIADYGRQRAYWWSRQTNHELALSLFNGGRGHIILKDYEQASWLKRTFGYWGINKKYALRGYYSARRYCYALKDAGIRLNKVQVRSVSTNNGSILGDAYRWMEQSSNKVKRSSRLYEALLNWVLDGPIGIVEQLSPRAVRPPPLNQALLPHHLLIQSASQNHCVNEGKMNSNNLNKDNDPVKVEPDLNQAQKPPHLLIQNDSQNHSNNLIDKDIDRVKDEIDKISVKVTACKEDGSRQDDELAEVAKSIKSLDKNIQSYKTDLRQYTEQADQHIQSLREYRKDVRDYNDRAEAFCDGVAKLHDDVKTFGKDVKETLRQIEEFRTNGLAEKKALRIKLNDSFNEQMAMIRRHQAEIRDNKVTEAALAQNGSGQGGAPSSSSSSSSGVTHMYNSQTRDKLDNDDPMSDINKSKCVAK